MALPEKYLRLTVEEYLAQERAGTERHEYLDGYVYQMAGESLAHSTINANVTGRLMMQLLGKPCRVLSPNMKVRASLTGLFAYPDAAVVCGEPQFHDKSKDILINPAVIVEVLSPSTENYDRGGKFFRYQQLESLVDYLLVSQDEPRIEHYARHDSGQWLYTINYGLDAALYLASIDCHLRLAEIYDRIAFPENSEASVVA
jgi:Uma2 family endonuclease